MLFLLEQSNLSLKLKPLAKLKILLKPVTEVLSNKLHQFLLKKIKKPGKWTLIWPMIKKLLLLLRLEVNFEFPE